MRIAHILQFFIFLILPLSIQAQTDKKKKKLRPREEYTRSRNALEPMPIHLSAMGAQPFYGLKLGIDYPFRMTEIRAFKTTSIGQRLINEQYIGVNLGIWHYTGVHENLYFAVEWTMRFINGRGYFVQISPISAGVSYILKPFVPEKAIQDSTFAIGKMYATPSVSFGIGRDFAFRRANKGLPLVVFVKGGLSALYSFGKNPYLFPTAELGLAVRIRGFNAFVKKVRRD